MKTPFFSRPDLGLLRKALILILVAVVIISIAIPGMILSKGNTLFALLYFAGFTFLFYSLLHSWQKSSYYAISIAIFVALPIIIINIPGDYLVKMEKAGKLPVQGLKILPGPLEVCSLPAFLQVSLALLEAVYLSTMMITTNK